jgi:phosphohistidine phosphatase
MMEIYVVRHGIAVPSEAKIPDRFRPLTSKGRRRFRRTARRFARLVRELDLILTSPLVRAVQTAEILVAAVKDAEVAVLEELDPKSGVEPLLEAVAHRADFRSVALVGHEPQLSGLVAVLASIPGNEIELRKGAIVRLDVAEALGPGSAELRWTLNPMSKEVEKGGRGLGPHRGSA